jgi:hypothetical protein
MTDRRSTGIDGWTEPENREEQMSATGYTAPRKQVNTSPNGGLEADQTPLPDQQGETKSANQISGIRHSSNKWTAHHNGLSASFNVSKYGPAAKTLAEDIYLRWQAGLPGHDNEIDPVIGRHMFPISLAATELSITVTQLRRWMVTGVVFDLQIRPPARVSNKDYIAGYELYAARQRLKDAQEKPPAPEGTGNPARDS